MDFIIALIIQQLPQQKSKKKRKTHPCKFQSLYQPACPVSFLPITEHDRFVSSPVPVFYVFNDLLEDC